MFEGGIWGLAIFLLTLLWCFVHYYYLSAPERPRRQPYRNRKKKSLSLNLRGSLFDPADLSIISKQLEAFLSLCATCNVYTILKVDSDEEEQRILKALEDCGAFDAGLMRHRVMFCSSQSGAVAMIRQLQPHAHVENDTWIAEQLSGKIRAVCSAKEGLQHYLEMMEAEGVAGD